MDRVIRLIHAQKEETFPYDGSGITAAILDTGEGVSQMQDLLLSPMDPHRTGMAGID